MTNIPIYPKPNPNHDHKSELHTALLSACCTPCLLVTAQMQLLYLLLPQHFRAHSTPSCPPVTTKHLTLSLNGKVSTSIAVALLSLCCCVTVTLLSHSWSHYCLPGAQMFRHVLSHASHVPPCSVLYMTCSVMFCPVHAMFRHVPSHTVMFRHVLFHTSHVPPCSVPCKSCSAMFRPVHDMFRHVLSRSCHVPSCPWHVLSCSVPYKPWSVIFRPVHGMLHHVHSHASHVPPT